MTVNSRSSIGICLAWAIGIFSLGAPLMAQTPTPSAAPLALQEPQPLVPGAKVVTLWPKGSPALRPVEGYDQPEKFNLSRSTPSRVQSVVNIHNPSIEVHLAPADKANGMAIIVAAGGGNKTCNVGNEGVDIADWLNGLGIDAFIERNRLRPYDSTIDALADTQRSIRMVRAHAKEWGVDPKRVGIMGFSAGGEQAAWATLRFDEGNPQASDPVERESCRPDFSVLVYAGWLKMDLSNVPKNAPPTFLTSAGIDDAFHARQTVEFYSALFEAKIPVELHIYGHGGHGGSISPRKGIPFGTWNVRFVEWAKDLGLFEPKK
ncbi:MAG TPA: alpha/beta hydrolase [Tepidisphaeraceae bacterium]|nr:alpha/beta hydrolase [Tepidisphaeraceae bacterium]